MTDQRRKIDRRKRSKKQIIERLKNGLAVAFDECMRLNFHEFSEAKGTEHWLGIDGDNKTMVRRVPRPQLARK